MKNLSFFILAFAFIMGCKTQQQTDTAETTTETIQKAAPQADAEGWYTLFDGTSLDDWQANENQSSFSLQDGVLKVDGKRSHLFYTGAVQNHNFKDFEVEVEIKTEPSANSGFYFHTEYQDEGWPSKGYEIQVNNSHTDWRRTASIYGIQDLKEVPTKDGEWFTMNIAVQGKHIVVKLNGEVVNEFTEPEGGNPDNEDRFISSGTFCIQAHDPKSVIYYRSVKVKPL